MRLRLDSPENRAFQSICVAEGAKLSSAQKASISTSPGSLDLSSKFTARMLRFLRSVPQPSFDLEAGQTPALQAAAGTGGSRPSGGSRQQRSPPSGRTLAGGSRNGLGSSSDEDDERHPRSGQFLLHRSDGLASTPGISVASELALATCDDSTPLQLAKVLQPSEFLFHLEGHEDPEEAWDAFERHQLLEAARFCALYADRFGTDSDNPRTAARLAAQERKIARYSRRLFLEVLDVVRLQPEQQKCVQEGVTLMWENSLQNSQTSIFMRPTISFKTMDEELWAKVERSIISESGWKGQLLVMMHCCMTVLTLLQDWAVGTSVMIHKGISRVACC